MIISFVESDKTIKIRWRDENRERKEKSIEGFNPYFFIRSTDKRPETYKTSHKIIGGKSIKQTGFYEYKTGDYKNLQGQSLTKVFYSHPKDKYNAVKPFTATWEGDVPICRRYCVDELENVPEYEMRKWYWDMVEGQNNIAAVSYTHLTLPKKA